MKDASEEEDDDATEAGNSAAAPSGAAPTVIWLGGISVISCLSAICSM